MVLCSWELKEPLTSYVYLLLLIRSGTSFMSVLISFPVRIIFICMWGSFFSSMGFLGGIGGCVCLFMNIGVGPVYSDTLVTELVLVS